MSYHGAFRLYIIGVFIAYGTCEFPLESTKTIGKNSTLELLHILMRHGPRTPVNTYPYDPYVSETFAPYGWGHLTNDAKTELFQLGKFLRKRYKNFLGPTYEYDFLHAQATASPRTLMSLSTVLASMFPPNKTPMEWNPKYNWQPIPIFSDPVDQDILLRLTASCPRYDEALAEVLNFSEVVSELEAEQSLFHELSNITGLEISSAADVNSLYITFLAEMQYGLTLPEWVHKYYPERMQFMAEQNYIYNAYTNEMRKIKGGFFLKKMFEEMQAKVDGSLNPEKRKLFFYCAHDWTITHILAALSVWERQMPNFSALVAFELYRYLQTNDFYVEIYLKNGASGNMEKLKIPGCADQCPLEQLIALSSAVLPDKSYKELCQRKDD